MAQKPSIPKGTRDFNAVEVAKRSYIMNIIKEQFELYGFQPIETPSFENSDTLMGKYGDEGDRLIFKILNSGDFLRNVELGSKFLKEIFRRNLGDAFIILYKAEFEDKSIEEIDNISDVDKIESLYETSLFNNNLFLNTFSDNIIEKIKKEFSKMSPFLLAAIVRYMKRIAEDNTSLFENSQRFSKAVERAYFKNVFIEDNFKDVANKISEKALRYDLTVPFARYVVQHQNEIEFPFKRYQIQPVWRADRPQKGRFREFYQCDADVVGSKSLFQEVEFVQLYDAVFTALDLKGVTIKINNRKILSGIAEVIGVQDKLIDFTVALDKLDKIGEEKVKEEMRSKGMSEDGISKLQPLFSLEGDFGTQVESLKSILNTSEVGLKGIEELEFIDASISKLGLKTANLQLDVTLARGLNYYTGAIFEVSAPDGVKMGSIGGGGRYDDLTSIFGKPDTSGVGISFGLDRIYLVLEELNLFPETIADATKVLFINFGDKEAMACLQAVTQLRQNGVKAELYPDNAKMKKQMTHANRRNIPYVVLLGEEELNSDTYTLKNMKTGEQEKLKLQELLSSLK
ncbi:histidine--tRNA ligase [Winogradskyella poriferorum]|uniref:Histidine--tRNA ligase n=1 Tax=Winogradskyella poriferorum TaxID=307627 RepID=A0ABU7W6N7_9FLAO